MALTALVLLGAVAAGVEPPEKRAEIRADPVTSNPSPSGPTPDRPGQTTPPGKPPEKCETKPTTQAEVTTVVEETTTVVQQEIVVLEAPRSDVTPGFLTFPEVLHDTVGRARMNSVVACTDPRYPLPSFAFVGMEPSFSLRSERDEVRLQRLDFEVETGSEWLPSDSVFTLAAGAAVLQVAMDRENHAEVLLVREVTTDRTYPLSASLAKSGSLAVATRYVISFQFLDAASGNAPTLQPGDGVYLSIDPSLSAPAGYAMPKFLLVAGNPAVASTLRLVEKTGTATSVLPAYGQLEMAAHLSVLHRLPQ